MIKEKIGDVFEKNKNMKPLYIIFIIGIVIILFTNFFSSSKPREKSVDTDVESFCVTDDKIVKQIEKILSQIRGAGDVSVMLTYESTAEKHYAIDVTSESSQNGEEVAGARTQSKQSTKLVTPSNEPVIVKQSFPKVMGVIVVCSGGDNVQVKANIKTALAGVLDVAEHKISVFTKK